MKKNNIGSILFWVFLFCLLTKAFAQEVKVEKGESTEKTDVPGSKDLWKDGSVMYSDKVMGWVEDAIKSFDQGIPLEILLPNIFPPEGSEIEVIEIEEDIVEEVAEEEVEEVSIEEELPSQAPAFYLKSLLYFSPKNWTIWLNDEKISYGEDSTQVRVVKVEDGGAFLLWQDTDLDYIYPEWKKRFAALDDKKYVSNSKNIVIDLKTGDVSFILKPNQSLVTSQMKVVEGGARAVPINAGVEDEALVMQDSKSGDGFLDDYNPAEGIVDMQKHMMQLNALKSILDQKQ